ncbi:uncharacterized protein LOC114523223 [Dendronephthya gigantea]|uniref:uncharacterized protein LOC114523223 n=1 Tax=Dendronephthya gigantea TaxID=151771 RepID=UPI00106A9426|nr:uncharacterized protein LOC114523223 [Dendronephthya gigantea]
MPQRSECLLLLGWLVALGLYITQACVLMKFLVEHTTTNSHLYWIGVGVYLLFALIVFVTLCCTKGYAQEPDEIWNVWFFWVVYIIIYIISVGLIFGEVAHKLDKSQTYGPNCLKITLCIAPALLVLVLQLVISPSYRKGVLALSVFAALDLFDGIEMLEIVLMQNEWEEFNLDESVEKWIITFACLSFLITSLGLTINKFDGESTVEEKSNRKAVCMALFVILFTNIPFLVLRVYIWVDCGYEASIFIAKNVVSLVVGFVEFFVACRCCTCE